MQTLQDQLQTEKGEALTVIRAKMSVVETQRTDKTPAFRDPQGCCDEAGGRLLVIERPQSFRPSQFSESRL
jgi:hypothetical protein